MKALLFRELKSVFCSPSGAFFALSILLAMGGILWFFTGNYNFIDGGYADMQRFFTLVPIFLIVMIPALTMRLFAEEKRNKTFDILRVRPVSSFSIYFSKFLATFVFVVVTFLPTLVYLYSLYQLANPIGHIDLESIFVSYISLLFLIAVFISLGLLGSVLTKNQVLSFSISVVLCLFCFYGFDLIAGLFYSGKIKVTLSSFGLLYHYRQMQRGVIQISDLLVIANYLCITGGLICFLLSPKNKKPIIYAFLGFCFVNLAMLFIPYARFDFTADKRYTLSDYTKKVLKEMDSNESLSVEVYLEGELNYGFQYLRNATENLLDDFNRYSSGKIGVKYSSPYNSNVSSEDTFERMKEKGMAGIMLNETDREGKSSRKVIYPYAQITNGKDTLIVSLLKNIVGNIAEENLNSSAESLEFEFADAIRLLRQREAKSIAFVEGHDEVSRAYVYDAEEILSKYYTVNRGEIGDEIGVLDGFDAVIIAGPLKKYSEAEKYILDQYIMNGGKMLWLVDGAYYSHQQLVENGYSASIKNEINLDDLLFTYGVRVNANLIQDSQCISTRLVGDNDAQSSILVPSYYQPLLIPSPDRSITKNIRDVKAGFASSIDFVNTTDTVSRSVLLTTSDHTHIVKVPETIDFDVEQIQNTQGYFNEMFVPVAVSLEGVFSSAFNNRMIPDSIVLSKDYKTQDRSKATKMIVVSSSDIITNAIQGQGADSQVLPMGYDRTSGQLFGNRNFIINAVNWLTDDDGLMALRTRTQQMYILNKKTSFENRDKYAVLNIAFPALFVLLIMVSAYLYRKKKYEN